MLAKIKQNDIIFKYQRLDTVVYINKDKLIPTSKLTDKEYSQSLPKEMDMDLVVGCTSFVHLNLQCWGIQDYVNSVLKPTGTSEPIMSSVNIELIKLFSKNLGHHNPSFFMPSNVLQSTQYAHIDIHLSQPNSNV